jgi:hypothetical protein
MLQILERGPKGRVDLQNDVVLATAHTSDGIYLECLSVLGLHALSPLNVGAMHLVFII